MEQKWWLRNNLRMIQNNIRDIDAEMDIDSEIKRLKEFGANVLQIGCGGISAFSETALNVQVPSPYLKYDMFAAVVEKCHQNGIRVIARFDISKTHEKYLKEHPEWFSRSLKGEVIKYHDTLATCVNGPYQQEESLNMIGEIMEKYPVDGIFFNMFGYQTIDYSGNYVGICQCDNCKRKFKEMYHTDLPTEENEEDRAFQKYKEFKTVTVKNLLKKISNQVHKKRSDVAVSTYEDESVDIIRMESNSAVDRALPFWIYQSSENVEPVYATFPDKIASNVAINAVDIPYRFMGVSKYLNQIRLFENMANGGGLDWCIIGSFHGYPDEENFETTKKIFNLHKRHEKYYGNLKTEAKILIIQPKAFYQPPYHKICEEYRGIFKMLKESHHQFTSVIGSYAGVMAEKLDEFDVIIIPGMADILDKNFKEKLKSTKATVIASGMSFENDPDYLKELFGVTLKEELPVRGSYMLTEPKRIFKDFDKRQWVYVDKSFRRAETEPEVEKILPWISNAKFGPPERCFGHIITEIPSVTMKNGNRIYLPWMPGTLYYNQGFDDFKKIYLDILDSFGNLKEAMHAKAPSCVEVLFSKCGEGRYLLHLLNLSGFNGMTVGEPLTIHNIEIDLHTINPSRVAELTPEGEKELEASKSFTISELDDYKIYLIEE